MKTTVIASVLLVALSGCSSTSPPPDLAPSSALPPGAVPTVSPPPAPTGPVAPRTINFVELRTGDCVTDLPPSDLSAVTVTVVDCARQHLAEVFARRDIEVNTALADVANRACAAGFSEYTGRAGSADISLTYLIDSNQDRTSNNPLPSTVICLARSGDGFALIGSLRR